MKGLRVLWRPRVTWAHLQEAPNPTNKVEIYIKIGQKLSVILDEIRVEAAEGPTRSRRTSVMSDSDYQANDAVESAFKRALKKAAPNMEMVEEEQSESSFAGSHRSEVRNHNFILNFKNLFFSNRNNHQCNRPMQHQPFLQCQVFLEFQKLQKLLPIYQVKINRSSKSDQLRGWVWYSILGTTMSSIPSIVSGKSAVTDITTASERSTNTTSTTSGASTIQECFRPRSGGQFCIFLKRIWLWSIVENHKSLIQNEQLLMKWMSNQKQVKQMWLAYQKSIQV